MSYLKGGYVQVTALNRKVTFITKMARLHGLKLAGTRELKRAIRALDPDAAFTVSR